MGAYALTRPYIIYVSGVWVKVMRGLMRRARANAEPPEAGSVTLCESRES